MKERLATILGCCWNFRAFILFILFFERAHARLKSLYGLGISPPAFATTPPLRRGKEASSRITDSAPRP